jgi:hypothetical protein
MLYTITITVESSNDLADAIESPELIFEGLVMDALMDVFEFIAVQEVRINPSPLEETHHTENDD